MGVRHIQDFHLHIPVEENPNGCSKPLENPTIRGGCLQQGFNPGITPKTGIIPLPPWRAELGPPPISQIPKESPGKAAIICFL